jgi:hypothetical protein
VSFHGSTRSAAAVSCWKLSLRVFWGRSCGGGTGYPIRDPIGDAFAARTWAAGSEEYEPLGDGWYWTSMHQYYCCGNGSSFEGTYRIEN